MRNIHYAVSGIVWDLDGTLLDSKLLKETVLNEVLRRRGLPTPTRQEYLHNSGGRLLETIQALTGLTGSLLQEIYDDFIQSEERYYERPESLFFKDALKLMQRAHRAGLTQILISNRPHYNDARMGSPRNLAKKLPLAGYIDAVVCGDDHDFCKPDPQILGRVEAELGLVRSELLLVGDEQVDIALACNIGARAVVVSRNDTPPPRLNELPAGWESRTQIVPNLHAVSVALAPRALRSVPFTALPAAA